MSCSHSTRAQNLDSNAKMWRLVADLMNDLGMLMDLVSPLFPSAFIFIVCIGSLSRSFTGVASGATRAALTQHFALQNNTADISAKEGSQETVATMIGMAFRNASCTHYNGTLHYYMVLFFVPHNVPHVC